MGDWLIVSVDGICNFYNNNYCNCSKTEAIRTFSYEYPHQVLLNIIKV